MNGATDSTNGSIQQKLAETQHEAADTDQTLLEYGRSVSRRIVYILRLHSTPLSQNDSKWIREGSFNAVPDMFRAPDDVNRISSEILIQSNYQDDHSTCKADRYVHRTTDF